MTRTYRIAIAAMTLMAGQMAPGDVWGAGEPTARPSKIETIPGTKDRRITLTAKAAKRLDIQTGRIDVDSSGNKTAPYVAVFYDLAGESWVYTNPEPLSYVKRRVTVASFDGGTAHLLDGPAEGVTIVTVGVVELYGVERGLGH